MVDYGFPWDMNAGLLGRSPGFSGLATTPTSILRQTGFVLEDRLHNYVSFIQIPAITFGMMSYEQ